MFYKTKHNNTTMAKKKTPAEQALFDIKKNLKVLSEQVDRLQVQLEIRTNQKNTLEEKLNKLRESKELEIRNISVDLFGDNYETYKDGYDFERHVVWWMNWLFPKYKLKIWQGDKICCPYGDHEPICPLWNKFPDLIYADDKKKKVLAIECKFRCNGIYELSKTKYLDYKLFEQLIRDLKDVDVQTCIMIGSISEYYKFDKHYSPNRPEFMYCIPINYFDTLFEKSDTCVIDLREYPQFLVMKKNEKRLNCFDKNIPF